LPAAKNRVAVESPWTCPGNSVPWQPNGTFLFVAAQKMFNLAPPFCFQSVEIKGKQASVGF
jgi:hypothetical protein